MADLEKVNQQYSTLAAQLGALIYQIELLKERQKAIIEEIRKLDITASMLRKNEKKNTETEGTGA